MKMAKEKKNITVLKFKVVGAEKADRNRWKQLGNEIKRISNAVRRIWLVEHTKLGNDRRVRDFIAETLAWHKANDEAARAWKKGNDERLEAWKKGDRKTRGPKPKLAPKPEPGPKPKCNVKADPKEIKAAVYEYVTRSYPGVHIRPAGLAMNLVMARLTGDKATKSAFPRWMLMLSDDGEYPSSSRPQPIPFDVKNSEVIPPLDNNGDFHVKLRITRIPTQGGGNAKSTVDVLKIQTKGQRCASQTAKLWKLVTGEYALCGSSLVFRESTGEWFVHICCDVPKAEKPPLDPDKTAVLRPGRHQPWFLRSSSYTAYVGGRTGRHVSHVRKQLLTQRWGRQEGYRHAGSARKGHGRRRALGKLPLLQNRWKDFVKTANQQLAKEVIDRCIANGAGQLIYCQPTEGTTRFLHNAGKVPGRRDATSWDWYQVGSILAFKCKEVGIELKVRKSGEKTEQYGSGVETQVQFQAAQIDASLVTA
jgi:hypothetical protein